MDIFGTVSDAVFSNTVFIMSALCLIVAICAYNIIKNIICAIRRPMLRSNNGCLEYYDFKTEVWIPIYGRENIDGYELFHILNCKSQERLESYRNKWRSVRELEIWIKKQIYED